jgi:hypothetical protein
MKKILYFAMIVLGALACTPDNDYNGAFWDYVGIVSQNIPKTAYEDAGAVSIPIGYGNRPTTDKAYTVNYKVTGGTYGADYTVEGSADGSGTVTVPAGQSGKQTIGFIKIVPIKDLDIEKDVPITITLESEDGSVNVGYPYKSTVGLTLGNDDCAYKAADWTGGFSAVEKVKDKSDVTYDVIVTPDADTPNKYNMTNFNNKKLAASFALDPASRNVTFDGLMSGTNQYTFATGTYVQCFVKLTVDVTLTDKDGKESKFTYILTRK